MFKSAVLVFVGMVLLGAEAVPDRKIGVFVRNHSSLRSLDARMPGLRDQLESVFAAQDGVSVVNVGRESGDASGLTPNLIRTLQCDYVALAGIASAGGIPGTIGGQPMTNYTLRMTLKVMDAKGRSIDTLPNWKRGCPVKGGAGSAEASYDLLFDQWLAEVEQALKDKVPAWPVVREEVPQPQVALAPQAVPQPPEVSAPKPPVAPAPMVQFEISTTIDQVVAELESQTRGLNGEMLAELRKVVGGATVEIDDVVEGSCPSTFEATEGVHRLRITRAWMKPYEATFRARKGLKLCVALEMNDEGVAKWGSMERLRAEVAQQYANAAQTRGVRVEPEKR